MSGPEWLSQSNEGLKYNTDSNLNPEIESFLKDGTLTSNEADALLKILDSNKEKKVGIKKITEKNLWDLRHSIFSFKKWNKLNDEDIRLLRDKSTKWTVKTAPEIQTTEQPKEQEAKEPKPDDRATKLSWHFSDFDWSGKEWATSNNGISFPKLFDFWLKNKDETEKAESPASEQTKPKTTSETNYRWMDLSNLDFRPQASRFPREASVKNNNPAWITRSPTFAKVLTSNWIKFYKWTARPAKEWWYYFWFPNVEEWMKAYNFLWERKLSRMWNKTFWDFAKNWAVDTRSYRSEFREEWDKEFRNLPKEVIAKIKERQMLIEAPWYWELMREAYSKYASNLNSKDRSTTV